MRERIILSSVEAARARGLPFSNPTSQVQVTEITHTSGKGSNEIKAIVAGFESKTTVSAEASGGVPGIGEAKVSVVNETTISASYENTTGRTHEESASRGYRLSQPPYTSGEGRLTWSEQTCQTRVRGAQMIDCEIEIYWWKAYRKYDARKAKKTTRHRKSHTVVFPSVQLLIALLEGRGSVHTPFFEHFVGKNVSQHHIDSIRDLITQDVDFLTEPFSEDSEFKTEILDLVFLDRPDAEEEDGDHEDEE